MNANILKINTLSKLGNFILLCNENTDFSDYSLAEKEKAYIKKQLEEKNFSFSIDRLDQKIYIVYSENEQLEYKQNEKARKAAHGVYSDLKKKKFSEIEVIDAQNEASRALAFAEGLALSAYKFTKYFTKELETKQNYLAQIKLFSQSVSDAQVAELNNVIEAVCFVRTLVNEPLSYLTAEKMSKEFQNLAKESGFKIEVFDKPKIESLKLGGLLAVNKGSDNPPTFNVLEWKPENAKNEKPIVLVGKGLVYDTGGLSLKPTPNSMDYMKCDMAGGAAVAGALYAIAKSALPVYVVGLVPATENSISAKAYVPGDVIKMHSGLTVEVLNTDAEGRLILADALSYAKKYNPELVLDIATLTGAAAAAVGNHGIVVMGNAEEATFDKLEKSGLTTYERTVRFPFWEEYGEQIKSSIADIKNIGAGSAGAITAGKFLEHFTDYKWIHLDIAGPSFSHKEENYRGEGGSGVGVRLFFDFIKKYFQ